MKLLFYLLILIILILTVVLLKEKSTIVTLICSLFILQIIFAPKLCIDAAISGVSLFFYKVFPSLFSFLVVSNIILCYDGINIYSKIMGTALCKPLRLPKSCSFVLIISVLCGYPLGAKYACDLLEKNIIDLKTCERLLNIASNGSPLFILGSVGISMLNNSYIGYILLLSNIISCILMGFMLPSNKIKTDKPYCMLFRKGSEKNIGDILKFSIENSLKVSLSIGGFVTIFSVLNNLLRNNILFHSFVATIGSLFNLSTSVIEGFLLGIIEMTNGCSLISSCSISIETKIALISFLFTFSGFSIISQVYTFTCKFNISMKKYIIGKILQGTVCAFTSVFLYRIVSLKISIETFNSNTTHTNNLLFIFAFTLFVAISPWLFSKIKKLLHTS